MYRLGIDVGGTNTDAVLVDENRRVAAEVKYPTSGDVYEGIIGAVRAVLEQSGVGRGEIRQAMLGTTQCTNAIVERKNLAKIGLLRIGAPATVGLFPPAVAVRRYWNARHVDWTPPPETLCCAWRQGFPPTAVR